MATGDAETTPGPRLHRGWLAATILFAAYAALMVVGRSYSIIVDHSWGRIPWSLINVGLFAWIAMNCWREARTWRRSEPAP